MEKKRIGEEDNWRRREFEKKKIVEENWRRREFEKKKIVEEN